VSVPAAGDPDVVALLEGWASARHGTLPRRLAHGLRHLIAAGVLPGGWRLPPERTLARALAVSRTTVTQALDELRGEDLLRSVQGSGTYVSGAAPSAPVGTRIAEHLSSGPGIDLAKGEVPDLSHLPPVALDMAQLNATCGGAAVNVAGLPALRRAVAELYTRGGVTGGPRPTPAEGVHITAGSHQASALLLSTLARRGRSVAVAELSYPGIFDVLGACELRAAPVRLDRGGLDPVALDEVLRRERPAAVYVQAGPQIPTGTSAAAGRVRALAEVVDRHRVPVIEDTTVAAVAFEGTAPMLADHCRQAVVASTGSLSKTCWSGLRLGWIRAPVELLEQTVLRHLGTDLGPSVPSQLLALELLPHLDEIAAERRRRLAAAVDAALDRLATVLPDAAVTRPDGGSILWLRLPVADTAPLARAALRHGVRVAPGSIHAADKRPGPFLRVDVDRPTELVREGIDRLAAAWGELRADG
jgi:DNA-binding transcriptional MocR family regulator